MARIDNWQDEIKITPEMIEAGLEAISGFELIDVFDGFESRRDLVIAIFLAMQAKRSQP